MKEGKSLINTKVLVSIIILILLGAVAYLFLSDKATNLVPKKETAQNQTSDNYQAVFLTNGQVYFGQLKDEGGSYVKLTEIYYLQAKDQEKVKQESSENQEPNLTLIKLGKELHAPADEMNISREQILFWEDITADGKVMQAIQEYKAANK